MYQSTSSPFGRSTQSNQQSTNSPFFNSNSNQIQPTQPIPSFSGPQFGGGTNNYNSNQSSNLNNSFQPNQQTNFNSSQNTLNSSLGSSTGAQEPVKHYLPGYLSGGALSQSQATPPTGDDSRNWDSPTSRASISGSPVSRFGGHSLFGPRDGLNSTTPLRSPKAGLFSRELPKARGEEMDQDAPPVESLGEMDGNDSMSSSPRRTADVSFTGPPSPSLPPSSSTGTAINVFGFPDQALPLIISHFAQFGQILSTTPNPEGGNWVTITFADSWSAIRAARRNGEILGGVMMVGVKLVEEDLLNSTFGPVKGISTPNGSGTGTSTPAGLGKPIPVISGSAFRPAVATPTRLGFFSNGNGVGGKGGVDAHAGLFVEKNLGGGQSQGLMAKASDLIFGW